MLELLDDTCSDDCLVVVVEERKDVVDDRREGACRANYCLDG